jgi:hypothetical protein
MVLAEFRIEKRKAVTKRCMSLQPTRGRSSLKGTRQMRRTSLSQRRRHRWTLLQH